MSREYQSIVHKYEDVGARREPLTGSTQGDLAPLASGGSYSLLGLQQRFGNRFVQRVVAGIQRDNDGDDAQKPPPLVGSDRAIDPKDNFCTLQWTIGGPKWLLPSGVACDPGVFGIPGHGDPFKYPSDQPGGSPGTVEGIDRPAGCPPERWDPPSPTNLYYGRCLPPGGNAPAPAPSSSDQSMVPADQSP